MERLERYIYELDALKQYLNIHENIVIYGAGDYGKKLVDYIISIGQQKKISGIIITEKPEKDFEYKGIKVHEAVPFLTGCEICHILIAASLPFQSDIARLINKFGREYMFLTNDIYVAMIEFLDTREKVSYQGIDFLLAGFIKCGTTSLHDVLIKHKDIYLSQKKESQFFSWCDRVENPEKILIEKYFGNIRKGQIVGMIEPTFAMKAEEIVNLFGSNIKVVFCVRNPIDVTFSRFKMCNREGIGDMEASYQRSNGLFCEQIFDECMQDLLSAHIHEYAHWIEEFAKYYNQEQIKVILFEDLVKNPQVIINNLLKFIGVSEKLDCKKLPVKNEGGFVMADLEGYKVARLKRDWYRETYSLSKEEYRKRIYDKEEEYLEIMRKYDEADKIYGLKITEQQKKKLQLYFNDSVRQLEKILNRDLTEIWF